MRTVISASRRTDIPGLYMPWFLECLKAGSVTVANPVFKAKSYEVDLRPETVHTIVLWSKNFMPFLRMKVPYADYAWYFNFTIDDNNEWVLGAPSAAKQLVQLKEIVDRFGADRVNWRFDPIMFWDGGRKNNEEKFYALCDRIAALGVTRCTFSFVYWYGKVERRAREWGLEPYDPPLEKKLEVIDRLATYAEDCQIRMETCSNDTLLGHPNVRRGSCIDGHILARLNGEPCSKAKDTSQRGDCGCTKSVDIGSYAEMPCRHACIHCYANPKFDRVRRHVPS